MKMFFWTYCNVPGWILVKGLFPGSLINRGKKTFYKDLIHSINMVVKVF